MSSRPPSPAPSAPAPRSAAARLASVARSLLVLVASTCRRQTLSRKTAVAAGLVACSCLLVFVAGLYRPISPRWLGDVTVLVLYAPFVFPVLLLGFGTGALGDEREDGTLVYLVTRPLPRWGISLSAYLAVVPPGVLCGLGGLWAMCLVARRVGEPGVEELFGVMAPAFLLAALAYLAFFHFLAAAFRRSTIIAIVYVLFVEDFLGTVPGTIKRLSIRFYASSMVFERGRELGVRPPDGILFEPIGAGAAAIALGAIAVAFLLLAMLVFARREHGDLD